MSKIHHNIYEKINYTIELPYVSEPINKLAEYIDLLPNHLNILNPNHQKIIQIKIIQCFYYHKYTK